MKDSKKMEAKYFTHPGSEQMVLESNIHPTPPTLAS